MNKRELTKEDILMFTVMNGMKKLSKCIDKQVVCLIVDEDYNILSVGINTIEACDKNCHDKENRLCVVRHAEQVAVDNLSTLNKQRARKAYVSLFPCVQCQLTLEPYVDEIVTFGMIHKQWISNKVIVFPHITYKLLECGENVNVSKLLKKAEEKELNSQVINEIITDIVEVSSHSDNNFLYLQSFDDRLKLYSYIFEKLSLSFTCNYKQ